MDDYKNAIIGTVSGLLDDSTEKCEYQECPLGNMVADAFRDHYIRKGMGQDLVSIVHADDLKFSFSTTSKLHNMTIDDVLKMMPTQKKLYKYKLPGSEIQDIFEYSPGISGRKPGETYPLSLQVSGIKVHKTLDQTHILVDCDNCGPSRSRPLNQKKDYYVVVVQESDPSPEWMDLFAPFERIKDEIVNIDAMINYIKRMKHLEMKVEGRIVSGKSCKESKYLNDLFNLFISEAHREKVSGSKKSEFFNH